MRAVDTNVLVRLLTEDDARQGELVEHFIEPGAWISVLVLNEAMWVLRVNYGLKPPRLAAAVEMLLRHEKFVLQDPELISEALALFRAKPSLGYADCLILQTARKNGHLPLGSFDRALSKLEGAHKI